MPYRNKHTSGEISDKQFSKLDPNEKKDWLFIEDEEDEEYDSGLEEDLDIEEFDELGEDPDYDLEGED